MSFWDNNKDTFKKAGVSTVKGIGRGTKAVSKAGYNTYKKSEAKRNGTTYEDGSTDTTEASIPYSGPPIVKVDKEQLNQLPPPPKRNVGAFEVPKSGEASMYKVQPRPAQPVQPMQPSQYGQQIQPTAPVQPAQYGQPAQPAQPGQYSPAQAAQPGQYGQQPLPAQPAVPAQPTDQYQNVPGALPARPIPPPPPSRSPAVTPNPTQPAAPLSYESPYHVATEAPMAQQPTAQPAEPAPINVNIAPMIPGMKNAANQLFQSYLQSQPLTPGAAQPPQQEQTQQQQPQNINIAPYLPALKQAGGSFLKAQAQQGQQPQQAQQPQQGQPQNQGNVDLSPYMPGIKLAAGSFLLSYQGQNAQPTPQPNVQPQQQPQAQPQQPPQAQPIQSPAIQQPPAQAQPIQSPPIQQPQQPIYQPPMQAQPPQLYQPTPQTETLPQYTPTAAPVELEAVPVEEEAKPVKKSKFLEDASHFAPPPTRREHKEAFGAKTGSSTSIPVAKKPYGSSSSVASPPPAPARPMTLPPVNNFAPPPKIHRGEHEKIQQKAKPSKPSYSSAPPKPTRPSESSNGENSPQPHRQSPQPVMNSFAPPPKIHRGPPGHIEEAPPSMPTRPSQSSIEDTPEMPPSMPTRPLETNIGSIKKAPPPKPSKKSTTVGEEPKREIPPPPYSEEEESAEPVGPPNFAQQIALQRRESPLSSKPSKPQKPAKLDSPPVVSKKPEVQVPVEQDNDFMIDLRNSLKKVNIDRGEKPVMAVPPKPNKPVAKPGPKPPVKSKPVESEAEVTSKPIIGAKPVVGAKPKPSISAKPALGPKPDVKPLVGQKPDIVKPVVSPKATAKPTLIKPPPVPPARRTTPEAASITSPKPSTPTLRSASATPPPPPPPRNYNRPAAVAPPKSKEGPPNLNLGVETGWLDASTGSQLPKDLQGLTYNTSGQTSLFGGSTKHTYKLNVRLKDLSIARYTITWTNADYRNASVELLEYTPSPITHKVPSKSELIEFSGRFGDYIASWCEHKKGQQVGRGECWDLAQEALLKGCGKHAFVSTYTHHGFPILLIAGSNSGISFIDGVGQFDEVRRGDILQFKTCIFINKEAGSTKTVGAPDHTAVVLDNFGDKLLVAEQNVNNQRFVVDGEYCLKDLTQGETHVYRPVPADWPGVL